MSSDKDGDSAESVAVSERVLKVGPTVSGFYHVAGDELPFSLGTDERELKDSLVVPPVPFFVGRPSVGDRLTETLIVGELIVEIALTHLYSVEVAILEASMVFVEEEAVG